MKLRFLKTIYLAYKVSRARAQRKISGDSEKTYRAVLAEYHHDFENRQIQQAIRRGIRKRIERNPYDELFQGKDRLQIPLIPPRNRTAENAIRIFFQNYGYSGLDYKNGCIFDANGQKMEIPETLQNLQQSDLFEGYRLDHDKNYQDNVIVLSRNPKDIALMSTYQKWESCRRVGLSSFPKVSDEIARSSLIAYLTPKHHPADSMPSPLARILLKPYYNEKGERILVPDAIFVDKSEAFIRTICSFAEENFNANKYGQFRLDHRLESEHRLVYQKRIPGLYSEMPAPDFLKVLGFKGKRFETLDVSTLGLIDLPDFSRMTVYQFDCRSNYLTSLMGSPNVENEILYGDNYILFYEGLQKFNMMRRFPFMSHEALHSKLSYRLAKYYSQNQHK